MNIPKQFLLFILLGSYIRHSPTTATNPSTQSTSNHNNDNPSPIPRFLRGELTVNIPSLGLRLSTGMSVRLLARADRYVQLSDGESSIPFHSMPDGAAVLPLPNGGWVYVSNSEMRNGHGGVYGVYFDKTGRPVDYKRLLGGTTRNCSGGKTPWNTWVSCEEYGRGQCWQVDPDPKGEHHLRPERTRLGQEDGGNFEAVACDDGEEERPVFFLSEDAERGALRRYEPRRSSGWSTLHHDGGPASFEYLEFLDGDSFRWTRDLDAARDSQNTYYPNVEGIDYFNGTLFFVSKKTLLLYALDLDKFTYTTTSTKGGLLGDGDFTTPDQIIRGNSDQILYLTEDGGDSVGVYALDKQGRRFAIFEANHRRYDGDETTGLAFSPDGTKMYACFQDCGCEDSEHVDFTCGCLLEFSRRDGRSFDGTASSLKLHSSPRS